ncbi:MAG: DUF502 domain-containing protein [Proteobacteria bacterium]|nr:DUF502 domain-containing protein [Pseudomonadota bacterium]
MGSIVTTFVRGLSVVVPVGLTVWLLVWLANGAETLLQGVFLWFFPAEYYLPGLGVLLGIGLIFAAGILVQLFLLKQLFDWAERLISSIPLVKTVYNSIRDFLGFFSTAVEQRSSKVVTVDIGNGASLIGFVTDNSPRFLTTGDLVAVYLPMSYMVGGFTILVPQSRLTASTMNIEEAMRYTLTAGLQRR